MDYIQSDQGSLYFSLDILHETYVEETYYFSFGDFLSTIGGYLALLQLLVAFLATTFIYKEYTSYMALKLFEKRQERGQEEEVQPSKEKLNELQKSFEARLSCEGIFNLHEKVAELKSENHVMREVREEIL
mmetsp:Transcript_14093/g.23932  ORF Transcript_14093/g.23932 Transcript_14093/m.23932 type:complete len:131 (+) Transcript_14093:1124-1516(+)